MANENAKFDENKVPTLLGVTADSNEEIRRILVDPTTGCLLIATTSNDVKSYVAVTATYSVLSSDYTVNCTSSTFTVTLPTAVGATGQVFVIKNSGIGTITIACTGGESIDGSSTKTLSVQYSSYMVQSTGSNWIII